MHISYLLFPCFGIVGANVVRDLAQRMPYNLLSSFTAHEAPNEQAIIPRIFPRGLDDVNAAGKQPEPSTQHGRSSPSKCHEISTPSAASVGSTQPSTEQKRCGPSPPPKAPTPWRSIYGPKLKRYPPWGGTRKPTLEEDDIYHRTQIEKGTLPRVIPGTDRRAGMWAGSEEIKVKGRPRDHYVVLSKFSSVKPHPG